MSSACQPSGVPRHPPWSYACCRMEKQGCRSFFCVALTCAVRRDELTSAIPCNPDACSNYFQAPPRIASPWSPGTDPLARPDLKMGWLNFGVAYVCRLAEPCAEICSTYSTYLSGVGPLSSLGKEAGSVFNTNRRRRPERKVETRTPTGFFSPSFLPLPPLYVHIPSFFFVLFFFFLGVVRRRRRRIYTQIYG